ncbi:MAG: hypothetical protein AB7S77_21590 [Desulfatirhabdiaceae bacterium]
MTHSPIGDTDNLLRDVPVEIYRSILPVMHHGFIHSQSRKFRYACQNCMTPIFYQKLIRDRIPEIIGQSGKTAQIRTLGEPEYRDAVGAKILEEAHELFAEWQRGDPDGVLKESADMIEILLAALQVHGLTIDDLMAMRQKRADDRGGFLEQLFLESEPSPIPASRNLPENLSPIRPAV